MKSTASLLLDAAHAAERFAELARAQLDYPSPAMADRVEHARAALLDTIARLPDQR